jgi:hypothetical protein
MEISNLRAGRFKRHALLLGSATLGALSLAGVAARPALGRQAVERLLAEAEGRVAERRAEVQALARFESGGGLERARAVLARLDDLVPPPLPDLELHGLLRLLCRESGVTLEALELGEPLDPGFERLGDVAALHAVHLGGQGRLAAVLALLAAVRALGRPVAVLEFHLSAARAQAPPSFTLELGFCESRPLADFPEEPLTSADERP